MKNREERGKRTGRIGWIVKETTDRERGGERVIGSKKRGMEGEGEISSHPTPSLLNYNNLTHMGSGEREAGRERGRGED